MDNGTVQAIFDRRSIRNFTAEGLTGEELELLERVALASPTGMNAQPWQFHFVTAQPVIRQISEATLDTFRQMGNTEVIERMKSRHESIFYGAPLVVVITMPKDASGVDAGIAVENLAVAAQSMGLGSCIIGLAGVAFSGPHGEESAKAIGMEKDREFAISIAIGHPAMSKEAHEIQEGKIIRIS